MRRNLSNITKEEASAKIAELNKPSDCPVCGPKRNRVAELSRHSDGIVTFLRDNNFRLGQDSCILCVEKHIADAKRAIEKGIKEVVYDRGGFVYQGKVAALAEAAREAGLEF